MGVVCLSMYVHTYGGSVSVWEGGGTCSVVRCVHNHMWDMAK